MIKFKIPYHERNVVASSLLPMKWDKTGKVWVASDTYGARYHALNGLSRYCITTLPKRSVNKYKECDIKYRHEPWSHQLKAYQVVCNLDNSYIYMLPGLGKSKVIVDYINTQLPSVVLICCPKVTINTWEAQIKEHGIVDMKVVPLIKGTSANKADIVKKYMLIKDHFKQPIVFIVNYDTVWRLKAMNDHVFDLVVFDEIHRLQSSGTSVNKFCKKLVSPKKVGLTGTPGEPTKWHGQFLCLDKNIFGTNRKKFIESFFFTDYFGQPKETKNLELLREHFRLIAHIEDNQAVINLKEAVHQILTIDVKNMKPYRQVEKEFMLEIDSGVVTVHNAMVKSLKLRQICSGFIMDNDGEVQDINDDKVKHFKEMLEDFPHNERIVVYYNFKHELQQIRLACMDRPFANISGSQKDYWAKDDPPAGTILAIQTRAGGTGLDGLQKHYHYCIYYSLTWSEIDFPQSQRRLWRAGQKEVVHFYYLITRGTIEEKVYESLQQKESVIKMILKGGMDADRN